MHADAETLSPIQQLDNFLQLSELKTDKKQVLHGNEAGHGNLQKKKFLTVDML